MSVTDGLSSSDKRKTNCVAGDIGLFCLYACLIAVSMWERGIADFFVNWKEVQAAGPSVFSCIPMHVVRVC